MFLKKYIHNIYFVPLVVVFALVYLIANANYSTRNFQLEIIILVTFFYVLWGILHHLIHHDLHIKIVIEYILIGTLGLSIIFFLLSIL